MVEQKESESVEQVIDADVDMVAPEEEEVLDLDKIIVVCLMLPLISEDSPTNT